MLNPYTNYGMRAIYGTRTFIQYTDCVLGNYFSQYCKTFKVHYTVWIEMHDSASPPRLFHTCGGKVSVGMIKER